MSLWQHKNIHKKHLLWAKLASICLLLHFIFLFLIFFVYQDNNYIFSISIHKNVDYSSPIMFMPCPITTTNVSKKTLSVAPKKPTTIIAKSAPQLTTVQSKPNSVESTTESKKPTSTTEPAKPITTEIKKEREITKQKMEETKKDTSKTEPLKTPEPLSQTPKNLPINPQENLIPSLVIPENAHICHNHRETEALRRGAQLQKELVQQWKPPRGISPDCMCEISFFVNKKGNLENLKTIKSSGIVMYDISARQALLTMKMPPWTYGKPLIISFKQ